MPGKHHIKPGSDQSLVGGVEKQPQSHNDDISNVKPASLFGALAGSVVRFDDPLAPASRPAEWAVLSGTQD